MKITFKTKIVAEVKNKKKATIMGVSKLLAEGKMKIETPIFFDEPTIILTEK
jgi:hypothetical protein